MILGHLAIAGIAKTTRFHRESLFFLTLASLGPDLVDKSANMLLGTPGRGISHSLIFFAFVIFICWIAQKSLTVDTETITSGLLMWASHLLGDFVEVQVLFWPFLGPLEPGPKFRLTEKLRIFYLDRAYPDQFWLEMFCITALVILLLSRLLTTKKQAGMVILKSKPSSAEWDSL
ncbi:MAG: metal-dependent hydrolase [Desulfomonilaceae bacterium]